MPSTTTVLRTGALAAAAALAAGCGGSDPDTAVGEVVTTDAGTVIVRGAPDARTGLRLEVQDSSAYAELGPDAPAAVRARLAGRPLGLRCRTQDGTAVGPMPLSWRAGPSDWGVSAEVVGAWERSSPMAAAVVSCEVRSGTPAGAGRVDVGRGPVEATFALREG